MLERDGASELNKRVHYAYQQIAHPGQGRSPVAVSGLFPRQPCADVLRRAFVRGAEALSQIWTTLEDLLIYHRP